MPSFFECAKTPRRFVEDFTQEEVEAFGPNLQLRTCSRYKYRITGLCLER
ncbi:unnamed protein product [Arabidopsis thaliana]|uniref:Uncharacterized protein n=2 Tax=Arabidopsis thaliana TaxID=3702 RepID=A0A654EMD7_ARATH|nr:uncharacterized protein AT1G20683 [Arabidopsis thaliana]ANM58144.1 hypothetical protein AT1G20683 [Arabidopsis thaliana]VYS46701.1 unnamed protein product [Arabidopsis thaliana]|eukprot:NP_001320601.1 hypothetical protein AT1G20683 [Arabidopsis thaliana]